MSKVKSQSNDQLKQLKSVVRELQAKLKTQGKTHQQEIELMMDEAYQQGYFDAVEDQVKFEDAYDKFIAQSTQQFEKEYLKQLKSKKSSSQNAKKGKKIAKAK